MPKKKVKNREPSKVWEHYSFKGGKLERKASCPKCGPGISLAEHKDRFYCGKCHFVQIKK